MKRVVSILLILLLAIFLLVGVALFVLLTPTGQEFLTAQVNRYLANKLNTRVEIGQVRLQWPTQAGIDHIYIEDLQGDTLVAAMKLQAGIDMWGLLRGKIALDEVVLENARVKVYRRTPQQDFNYQFIVNAFASQDTVADSAASPLDMSWDKATLKAVHLSYYDDAAGIDTDLNIQDAGVGFSAFNPSFSRYHPTDIRLERAALKVNLFTGTDPVLPAETPSAPSSDTLDLKFGKIDFRDITVTYDDAAGGMKGAFSFPKLLASVDHVYLDGQRVAVKELTLEGSKNVVAFEKTEQPKVAAREEPSEPDKGWTVTLGRLNLDRNDVQFDDENSVPLKTGVDFSHLQLTDLGGRLTGFVYSQDSTAGKLENLVFADKSGFQVNKAAAEFAYTSRQAYLKELLFETPNSTIGDHVRLDYANLSELTDNPANVRIDMNLVNSRLGFKDLLLLAPDLGKTPPFDTRPAAFVQGSAKLSGKIGDLQIRDALFTMPEATRMRISGGITGLPDTEKLGLNLTVDEITTRQKDLLTLIPKGTLPDSVSLPETMTLKGKVEGSLQALKVDAHLETDRGNIQLAGDFLNITDSLKATYNGTLSMESVDVGKILMKPAAQLGKVSLTADFSGSGLTATKSDARLQGVVAQAEVMGYNYTNLKLEGNLKDGLAGFKAAMDDPNAAVTLNGTSDLNLDFPSVNLEAGVKNLDLFRLKLYSDSVSVAGNFKIDLASTNPDNPLGTIVGNNVALKKSSQQIPVGDLRLQLQSEGAQKSLKLESAFADATLQGVFDYTALGDIIAGEIDRYFQVTDTLVPVSSRPYNLDLKASVNMHDALRVFAPALTKMERVDFTARLTNTADTTLQLDAAAPLITYDSTNVEGLVLKAYGDGQKLVYNGNINEVLSGSFRVRNFNLNGNVADNVAVSKLTVKDSLGKDQHTLGAKIRKEGENMVIGLQNRVLFNYRPWRTDTSGYVSYGKDGVLVKNFTLFRNRSRERLVINSVGDSGSGAPYPNGPIRITADSVAIGPLVELFTRDAKLASGRLDGDINVRDYMGEAPVFKGDVSVEELRLMEVAMGDFNLSAKSDRSDRIDLLMTLRGENNDLSLSGIYASGARNPFDLTFDIKRLDAKLIEAFSGGELRNGGGNLAGSLTIKGNTENPALNGKVTLNELAFHVKQMGARYTFENGEIKFDAPLMKLSNLTILDSLGQKLVVNGNVSLDRIPDVGYNLTVSSDRFMLLNASRKDNELVYGKVFAGTRLSVKGRGSESIVDGSVKIQEGSNATLILPDEDAGLDRGDGVVEFVKRKEEETAEEAGKETGVVVDFASELSLNIETDPTAEFTIVLDEMNGDHLKVRGNARLNTGLAPNGQLYLLGSYEVEEGAYELTLEILKKQFDIRKGSQLIWSGDPMQAELDITAVYGVLADPSAFSPTNYAYGKIPFNVLLRISGNLSNPRIAFDLEVDAKAGSAIKNKIDDEQILTAFRNDASEMNKQVFGLLLLNKFMAETSNVSFGGFSAEAIARQSVSKMLSDQLNNLAADLIKGVQLDFNLNSTTGTAGARTDLNVGLTKGFLNDRITVSVGRNFELENSGQSAQSSEIFDNIAVNYRVTRDGRYVVRAYRKNQFQTVLEGFIVETGVSFIVTLDYDKVKEFFR